MLRETAARSAKLPKRVRKPSKAAVGVSATRFDRPVHGRFERRDKSLPDQSPNDAATSGASQPSKSRRRFSLLAHALDWLAAPNAARMTTPPVRADETEAAKGKAVTEAAELPRS